MVPLSKLIMSGWKPTFANSLQGLTESNSMKLNVFTPSSQNNTNNINNITPLMPGAGGGGVAALGSGALNSTGPNLNSSSIQNVRRSSRLFVSSQQSKSKENSKGVTVAPAKATRLLRSPSRKSKTSTTSTSNRYTKPSNYYLAHRKWFTGTIRFPEAQRPQRHNNRT